ncbi:C40 family peptidase [Hydrocarboniphaga effusa]|jgi:cell wall-associated NlpC family hydrolase|uniref:C40 family peptidase n=1 Tax=Hydrocarboniphaga effusa TaxID=243629 RepID=UPI0031377323
MPKTGCIWLCIALTMLLAGCAGFGGDIPAQISDTRQTIVFEATGQIGRPYRYGGTTPDGFDCSGLTRYVYAQAGVSLPRSTREQHDAGRTIKISQAQPGDLLFYRFGRSGGNVDHVAIYLGNGEAVHAPATGRTVIVASVGDPWWEKRFVNAVRVIP